MACVEQCMFKIQGGSNSKQHGKLLPTIIEDSKSNTTEEEVDPILENSFGDTRYFFQWHNTQQMNHLYMRQQEDLPVH